MFGGRDRTRDYLAYALSAIVALVAASILAPVDPEPFGTYFGKVNPTLAVVLVGGAAALALRFLELREWWSARPSAEIGRGILLSTRAAVALASVAIAIDIIPDGPD